MEKTRPPIPVCCKKPLVMTLMFRGAEFYCLDCQSTYGIMEYPGSVQSTPALVKLRKEREAKFQELAKDCIPAGSRRNKCKKCKEGGHGFHSDHATPAARVASAKAYDRLLGNTKGPTHE